MIQIRHKETDEILYRLDAATLDGVDLHDADLHQASLAGMQLRKANLQRAKLNDADLQNADFTGADLQKARLKGADLREAVLTGANLQRSNLDSASLANADMSNARLDQASLRSAMLQNTNLGGASLKGCKLEWADLSHARFGDAVIAEANFYGADLRGADLAGVVGFDTANFTEAIHDDSTKWPETAGEPEQLTEPLVFRLRDALPSIERPLQFSIATMLAVMLCLGMFFAFVQSSLGRAVLDTLYFTGTFLLFAIIPGLFILFAIYHRRIQEKEGTKIFHNKSGTPTKTKSVGATPRKEDVVGHAIDSIWKGKMSDQKADDQGEAIYFDWYVRLDDGRILELGCCELSLASVTPDSLQAAKVFGTQWVRAPEWMPKCGSPAMIREGQIMTDEEIGKLLVGQPIREVILEDDCGDDQLIVILANGCRLYHRFAERGNILQLDVLDEQYEDHSRDPESRTYFEHIPCDHLGKPVA